MPCPERPDPILERTVSGPEDPEDPEVEWTGVTIFSDVQGSTPPEDSQQNAPLQIACFTWCDDPICGGPGGFLIWYSNNPEHLEQGCSHPDNPIPGMLA